MAINDDELAFFTRFHSELDDLEMRMHGFAHYIQGALAAEQAAGPNPGWLENADATRCAIKWVVEDGELLKSCQSLLSAMTESDAEAKERPLEVALRLIALILVFIALYGEMESFRGTGKGENAYMALGNSAAMIFESIHTLRRNVERKQLA